MVFTLILRCKVLLNVIGVRDGKQVFVQLVNWLQLYKDWVKVRD